MVALWPAVVVAQQAAFEHAEGFGATSRGGAGGTELRVTSLDDTPQNPRPGTLRWAVQQPGPRIVRFGIAGNIRLRAPLTVTEPFLTLDGDGAPGLGICICDHALECRKTHDVIVRHLRFRHGDIETLRAVEAAGIERPKGSRDLDCVSLDDSQEILFDHCSLSWCCDEIFGIVRCKNVTIQWCLIAEPLANPRIHPYGDRHAFGLNCSASTLSVHHCLIAHYVMRGPQFEANDVRRGLGYDVEMEAVNNVMFDYEQSGSRYKTGVEDHHDEAVGTTFRFQFLNNTYINPAADRPEVMAVLKYGIIEPVEVFISGNAGPHRPAGTEDELAGVFTDERDHIHDAADNARAHLRTAAQLPLSPLPPGERPGVRANLIQDAQRQLATPVLFAAPIPVSIEPAAASYDRVLDEAGCAPRDAVDQRVIDNVRERRFGRIVKSQADVGGWPELK
jgi:hypothetical protein